MSPNSGEGGVVGSQPMRTAVYITWHGANFGDLTPYFTYDCRQAGRKQAVCPELSGAQTERLSLLHKSFRDPSPIQDAYHFKESVKQEIFIFTADWNKKRNLGIWLFPEFVRMSFSEIWKWKALLWGWNYWKKGHMLLLAVQERLLYMLSL